MLKHFSRSGMVCLFCIFNLSWSSHCFPSIWKTSSIIFIYIMGKPLDSTASFRSISITSCVSKLFESIILLRLLFFLEFNSFLSPAKPVSSRWSVNSRLNSVPFSVHYADDLVVFSFGSYCCESYSKSSDSIEELV